MKGLSNLALLYLNQGKYAQAEPLYQRVLAITEKALGPNQCTCYPECLAGSEMVGLDTQTDELPEGSLFPLPGKDRK